MSINFIKGYPALMIEKERFIVVSDLHIGLESKFKESGVYFTDASKRMSEELLKIYNNSKAKGIVFLGDIKERLMNVTKEEQEAIREFFTALTNIKIKIARGNHDAYLDKILKDVGFDIEVEKEVILQDVALLHGNSLPSEEAMNKNYILVGHGHVTAEINGAMEKVWLIANTGKNISKNYKSYNKNLKLVVVPAFNRVIMGSRLSAESKSHLPLFRSEIFDINSAKVYDLNGIDLGRAELFS